MLRSVLSTLVQVIVPLSIPVTAGALLARFKQLETKHLLTIVLYLFSPCVIFQSLSTAQITFDDFYKTVLFSILNLFLLWGAAKLTGRILKLPDPEVAGLTLISTFTNCVNYGIPLILLALGQAGLEKASVYIVSQIVIVNTVGVYFAARSSFSAKNAFSSVFSLPAVYAAAFAVLLRALNLGFPDVIQKGISMVAQAYSPVVLCVLGAQMANVKRIKLSRFSQSAFTSGLLLRLLAAPAIALLLLTALSIKGTLFSALLILSSMPVAVNAVVLAERFDAAADVVSRSILWTTIASLIFLPLLIAVLK